MAFVIVIKIIPTQNSSTPHGHWKPPVFLVSKVLEFLNKLQNIIINTVTKFLVIESNTSGSIVFQDVSFMPLLTLYPTGKPEGCAGFTRKRLNNLNYNSQNPFSLIGIVQTVAVSVDIVESTCGLVMRTKVVTSVKSPHAVVCERL